MWPALEELCEEFAAPIPSPAGGSAAAATAALSASLVVMAGRGSPQWEDGEAAAAQAAQLRDRLTALGREDISAVGQLIHLRRQTIGAAPAAPGVESDGRDVLVHGASVPLEIAQLAAAVVQLAEQAVANAKRPMRADAAVARTLAAAAARSAASIVFVNLRNTGFEQIPAQARNLREAAETVLAKVSETPEVS